MQSLMKPLFTTNQAKYDNNYWGNFNWCTNFHKIFANISRFMKKFSITGETNALISWN